MKEQDLRNHIIELEEQLRKDKEELYNLENQELFKQMDANIGKCYESTESIQGEDKIMHVVGVDKKHKVYKVNIIYYNHTLIGWSSFSASYLELYYDHINDREYREISKEEYFDRVEQYFNFAHQTVVDIWKNK